MSDFGIILVNKSKGISSFDVIRKIRKVAKIKKVGHAGTLDPLAEGLMVVAIGKYTKLCNFLSGESKVYETVIHLGQSTTTDDLEGEIIAQHDTSHVTKACLRKALLNFKGKITQKPPAFSAIKINGVRAYKLARDGQDVSINPRSVTVHDIKLTKVETPFISATIHCSKGTYIRSIARDLGESLGVGAYARKIFRVACGRYHVKDAVPLDALNEENFTNYLLKEPPHLNDFSHVTIGIEEKHALQQGQHPKTLQHNQGNIAYFYQKELVALVNGYNETHKFLRVI